VDEYREITQELREADQEWHNEHPSENCNGVYNLVYSDYEGTNTSSFVYGFNIRIDKPIKYDVIALLKELSSKKIIRINGIDDIKADNFLPGTFKTLREVYKYAQYLDDRAYFSRKSA
jgi:hypothetical protein